MASQNYKRFEDLKCGNKFESKGFYLIKCETFSDFSKQIWNSIDLKSGTLFFTKNDEIVELIEIKIIKKP
jgi:hypothetical protein